MQDRRAGKKNIDQAKVEAKRAVRRKLETLYETGDEEAFVALVKSADPDIKPERLLELIRLFREQRRSSALGGSKPS
jgi:hypothetical protein